MWTLTPDSRQHCEKNAQNGNLFVLGAALFLENYEFAKNIMTTKTHRRKMYAVMECESGETSGLLQVIISAPETGLNS